MSAVANCIRVVVTCRICGAEKRETNHWYFAESDFQDELGSSVGFMPWNDYCVEQLECRPVTAAALCGQECCQVALSRWLEHRSFDAPRKEGN